MSRRVVVEADGGSRGNPGPAGYGALVRDADSGELLAETAAGIGVASNNVAEYRGLIAGLTEAIALGADDVEVRMDSLLVVNQMSGTWKVKHEAMKPLASEAAALVRRLGGRVRFRHVPRERNTHADRLANEAMDDAARGLDWTRRGGALATGGAAAAEAAAAEAAAAGAGAAAAAGRAATGTSSYGWSAAGAATVAWLLRHGETSLSPEKRFSGTGDPDLTDKGRAQAAAAAAALADAGLTAVVTSPRRRCRQTATAVAGALGLPVEVDDGLAETDFGAWEGLTFAEVRDRWPGELRAWAADPEVAPPGGESFAATAVRVAAARDRVLAAHPGTAVLLVSHVTPIKTLLRDALLAPMQALYRMQLDPASLSLVDWYDDGRGVVRLVNGTGHLTGGLATASR